MKQKTIALLLSIVCALTALAQPAPKAMKPIAESYVKLVLAMTPDDADYVDA